ncbi:MAG TPA: DNA modification methylase [Bacteroidales bacterium]|nr:DNA modification methylase [Bacteroidales bacterium]HCB60860.1 DNA modification methylase [Bacteroidales bacterium]HCY23415.1 DNA modification methylase [Bacteroidales bacterium]
MSNQISIHGDCLDVMKTFRDNQFDIGVVDPPYFSGPEKRRFYGKAQSKTTKRTDYPVTETWEVSGEDYFRELFRVTKHQIIWGINYFDVKVGPGRIIWDKVNGDSSFSDCEIAYCSLIDSVRLFRFMWNGMCQGESVFNGQRMQGNKKLNEKRIHPTQKPVSLYKWTYMKFVELG